ncbi:MAG TPA: hypothetical protein VFG95_07815, partial [Nitrospiria bacterium]|nr:hypothetical protein [Nitrospiria bacterium]
DKTEEALLKGLIERHLKFTGSEKAKRLLDQWPTVLSKFVRVMSVEYKKVLEERARKKAGHKETVRG